MSIESETKDPNTSSHNADDTHRDTPVTDPQLFRFDDDAMSKPTSIPNVLASSSTSQRASDHDVNRSASGYTPAPTIAPLRISTDVAPPVSASAAVLDAANLSPPRTHYLNHESSSGSLKPISRTPSLKAALAHSYNPASATSSAVPSPIISAMGDMTPLPSPLLSGDSPGPWKKLNALPVSPSQGRHVLRGGGDGSALVTSSGESIDAALTNATKRRLYASLEAGENPPAQPPHELGAQHQRNRSTSEYVPESSGVPRRQVTVSGSHPSIESSHGEGGHMKREANLAKSRGLTPSTEHPPTPPGSDSSKDFVDNVSKSRSDGFEYFEACGRRDGKRRRWRSIRTLGEGTFSRVVLATSQRATDGDAASGAQANAEPLRATDSRLDRKSLVAIKICEHGPRGGASEDRVEMSLKRELEIMQSIHHPSLVDLKAWNIEPTRAILMLSYCPGGDLFDVASTHRDALKPQLLQRIFSEVVGAVKYLHGLKIVHRDIKLENVLVNVHPDELKDESVDWATYPNSVVTLTDLGLSRRVSDGEMLETRCGSDDYAAPEVIMGQPYDGRAIDAWSLGVLLYALLEARLPFDAHPGMSDTHRMRSRTSHRIARVEWRWLDFAGDDGDHDGNEALFRERGLLGAMEVTEGLLKRARSRWTLDKLASHSWVAEAVQVEGGVRFREEDQGEEVPS